MKKKNWLNIVLNVVKYAIALILGAGIQSSTDVISSVM